MVSENQKNLMLLCGVDDEQIGESVSGGFYQSRNSNYRVVEEEYEAQNAVGRDYKTRNEPAVGNGTGYCNGVDGVGSVGLNELAVLNCRVMNDYGVKMMEEAS
ncbi:hypothetical protein C5167_013537 [Papaver somniferum]|uniref:Uncharacterized protein n=1 Tax=Papaver somniferum TaxID=3469 RepID=A0A4Y7J2M1_PAPSO|nr:hypothetical protein C5167_013537 [Papaver somniferum]